MLSEEEIKEILKKEDLKILKSLGQNFLIDGTVLQKIIKVSDLEKEDVVFEIGPGFGTLTKELSEKCGRVIAIEKDKKLAELLKSKISCKNVEVINDDILKIELKEFIKRYSSNGRYKLVSNIPYYITSPIIKMFLESDIQPESITLLMQKEVAERICAKPGKLSVLALSVQIYGEPEIAGYVDKSSFYPEPKVDSAILKIKNIHRDAINCDLTKDLFKIIKIGFSSKRKKIANNFSAGLHIEKIQSETILLKTGIDLNARAQELSLEEWRKLAILLKDQKELVAS